MKQPNRIVKAFIAGPWAVVPFAVLAFVLAAITKYHPDLLNISKWPDFIAAAGIISAVAVVMAYMHVIVWGIPCYFYLKKTNRLSLSYILPAAFATGAMTGILLVMKVFAQDTDMAFVSAVATILAIFFGLCGMTVAYIIWDRGIR
jgi:hypothetical protein